MGAGNPLIRSFDTDRYQPTTYFIDFTETYESPEALVKENMEANEQEGFEDLTEDEITTRFYWQLENDLEEFKDNYFFEKEFFGDKYSPVHPNDSYVKELSAEYMGGGSIIAQSSDAYIVTTTDSEYSHYAIGIVPKFKYDELIEEVDYEQESKYDWYEARNKDYNAMCENLAEKLYTKKLKLFLKNNEPTMRKLHQHYGKQMRKRDGAWMSYGIKTIGKDFKFL